MKELLDFIGNVDKLTPEVFVKLLLIMIVCAVAVNVISDLGRMRR